MQKLATTIFLCVIFTTASAISPVDLRCDYEINPVGIDNPQPELSWKMPDSFSGKFQSAYQILAASSEKILNEKEADLWNSGKVISSASHLVKYNGKPLKSSRKIFWRVRIWDESDKKSDWSQPANWTMGILDEWKAKWIEYPDFSEANLKDAFWIWFPEQDWTNQTSKISPPNARANCVRTFTRSFIIPGGKIKYATLAAAADNSGIVLLNGKPVLNIQSWNAAEVKDVANYIAYENIIQARITNGGSSPNPAGFILKLEIEFESGRKIKVVTDESWDSYEQTSPTSNSEKTRAIKLARYGDAPWGEISVPQVKQLPLFRKSIKLTKDVKRAVAHLCGLGQYDFFIDGKKVGNHFLDPPWSVYEKRVYYNSFDVTEFFKKVGAHSLGVMLGKGFYNTAGDRRVHGVRANRPLKFICQIHLFYADSTEEFIISDDTWKTHTGPITHSAILGGEDYDARLNPENWLTPDFNDTNWKNAKKANPPEGRLVSAISPPLTVSEVFKPVKIDEPKPGIFVYDFGQNVAGIPSIVVSGKSGQTIRLIPAEQRHNMTPRKNDGRGAVNQAGVGSPNYFSYTLKGDKKERWTPQFSYTGFQYIQLEGGLPEGKSNPENKPRVKELYSLHIRNRSEKVGEFKCSKDLFNKIDDLIHWAVKANMSHVLTDCPHREKLGWLEVPYLMGNSIASRYNIARFYTKIARDCSDSQTSDGMIPTVAPSYPRFSGGFAYTPEWGAAGVIIPWIVYKWYGDTNILRTQFDSMKSFVLFMKNTSKDLIPIAGLGDWYDYGHGKPAGPSRFTPPELSAMATFYRCADIVEQSAKLLGYESEREYFSKLKKTIYDKFNQEFFNGKDEYKNNGSCQTANSMALVAGIVPDECRKPVLEKIIADIKKRGNQQTAGDIGHWYLIQALAQNGRSDVIFDILNRTNIGSYGFIINNGWTSMPEAWDADTGASMNHCMLGHIQEWFMGWLGGIRPDPESAGFKSFILQPEIVGDIKWVNASYNSPYGRIISEWKIHEKDFIWKIKIPFNSTALAGIPALEPASLKIMPENPEAAKSEFKPVKSERNIEWFVFPPGSYLIKSRVK